ncbi:hypothetical protein G3N57_14420 [Paraburkholderia sp. Se-20369]|nr:hypothetical protein [Paraburkholderia sp. Se-20369]
MTPDQVCISPFIDRRAEPGMYPDRVAMMMAPIRYSTDEAPWAPSFVLQIFQNGMGAAFISFV